MLRDRMRGLLTLHILIVLVVVVAWFRTVAVLVDLLLGKEILFFSINFLLYEVSIATAVLLANALSPRDPPRGSRRAQWIEAVKYTNKHLLGIALLVLGAVWATKDQAISRQFVAIFLASTWVLLLLLNRYLYSWLGTLFFRGTNNVRTVLVGPGFISGKILHWIHQQRSLGVDVIGLVLTRSGEKDVTPILPVLGSFDALESIIERSNAGQIVVLEPRSRQWIDGVRAICQRQGCRLLIYNQWEEAFDQPLTVVTQGELTFFTYGKEPLQNPVNRVVKRTVDLMIAIPVALCLLPPLALCVKVMHVLQSPGPLFFKQVRTGHAKVRFSIYKFRTMHVDGDERAGRRFAFGQFLRRTSLDELPQFLNVIQGTMSIVGPRPHMLADDERFAHVVEVYKSRHFVKPGITGLAQQLGFRGEIRAVHELEGRVQLDLKYVRSWSVWMDICIIVATAIQVLHPPKKAR